MGIEREITFTISGETITTLAREMLYEGNNLTGAIELLMASTETEELSEGDRLKIAIDILNGKKKKLLELIQMMIMEW